MSDFLIETLEIIRATRNLSLPQWGTAEISHHKSASAHDVVTQVDQDIEAFLKEEFNKLDPSISFVGEEFGGDRQSNKFWLVDPVDGTAHYIRGLPFCTTMVALVENGKVVFSAIYDFVNDDLYYAAAGGGAFKNDERIFVSTRTASDAYVAYESNLKKEGNIEKYLSVKGRVHTLNLITSGYEFVLVATGKIEGRICVDPYGKDYDFAPGTLLVAEAGGKVTNIGSDTYDYTNLNFIASNQEVHKALTLGADAIFPRP